MNNTCWKYSDQQASLARDTGTGSFARATDGLPMQGDFDALHDAIKIPAWDSMGGVGEEAEEIFTSAYLGHLEELAEALYASEVKAEDAPMQAAAMQGDTSAVDYCHLAQI